MTRIYWSLRMEIQFDSVYPYRYFHSYSIIYGWITDTIPCHVFYKQNKEIYIPYITENYFDKGYDMRGHVQNFQASHRKSHWSNNLEQNFT